VSLLSIGETSANGSNQPQSKAVPWRPRIAKVRIGSRNLDVFQRKQMFAIFGLPGIFELLIIAVFVLVPIALVVVVAVLLTRNRKPGPEHPHLTPCPDCGRLISRRATSCPHCGRPFAPGE
jgi:hypothetical protein